MSTRPPGYFSRGILAASLAAMAGLFRRGPKMLEPAPRLDFELPISEIRYQGGGRRLRSPGPPPERSQYDVVHAGGGISYAEHDAHVRSAMRAGVERASWRVWHGMRDDRLPHENNRGTFMARPVRP